MKRFEPVAIPEPQGHDYHVMVKPTGGICNLQCAYCYYLPTVDMYKARSDHSGSFRMSLETYELFARQYIDRPVQQVSFAWQGGEPTLMGLDWFGQAIDLQNKHRRANQAIENSLQTNGTLLDDAWCEFFREHGFLIGLSVDGPASYHDKYPADRGWRAVAREGPARSEAAPQARRGVQLPGGSQPSQRPRPPTASTASSPMPACATSS